MWKVLRLAGLAVAVALLASCSAESGGGTITAAAKLLWGLVDGQRLMIYGLGMGKVRQLDASTYEFDLDTPSVPSAKITYTFSEPSPCHVDTLMQLSSPYAKPPGTTISADFTKITGIEVTADTSRSGADIGKQVGLNVVWIKFAGGEFVKPSLPVGYLFTSLTPADFQSAADELQRIC